MSTNMSMLKSSHALYGMIVCVCLILLLLLSHRISQGSESDPALQRPRFVLDTLPRLGPIVELRAPSKSDPTADLDVVPSETDHTVDLVDPSKPGPTVNLVDSSKQDPTVNLVDPSKPGPTVNLVDSSKQDPTVNLVDPSKPGPKVNLVDSSKQDPTVNLVDPSKPGPTVDLVDSSKPGPTADLVEPSKPGPTFDLADSSKPGPAVNLAAPSKQGHAVDDLVKPLEPSPKESAPKSPYKSNTLSDNPSVAIKFHSKSDTALCDNTCPVNSFGCSTRTEEEWMTSFRNGPIQFVPLLSENEYILPWELDYLSKPPLTDAKTLPDASKSKIYFRPPGDQDLKIEGDDVVLEKNVPATFRVELLDGYDRHRKEGGDDVRAWLTGSQGDRQYSMTAQVNDFKNGTYDVIATPTWAGKAELQVAVSFSREHIRAELDRIRRGHVTVTLGKFSKGSISEVTLCAGTPNIPGRPCVCNLTKWNRRSWFCGRPLDNRLSCEDNPQIKTLDTQPPEDVALELTLAMEKSSTLPCFPCSSLATEEYNRQHACKAKQNLRHNFTISVKDGVEDPELPPCTKFSGRETWTKSGPGGVWSWTRGEEKVWTSLICREPEMSDKWAQKCLRSTKLWMVRDSNGRMMIERFPDLFGCPLTSFKAWPSIIRCENETNGFQLSIRPHEYPHHGSSNWTNYEDNGGVAKVFNLIPSRGSHVVVLHYYLDLMTSHLSVLHERLAQLKPAIRKLVKRNPSVLVVLRGPHIDSARSHLMRSLYLEVFKDVPVGIVFLDAWDRTLNTNEAKVYPDDYVYKSLWRTILSYRCS